MPVYVVSDQGDTQRICNTFEEATLLGCSDIDEFYSDGYRTENSWSRGSDGKYRKQLVVTLRDADDVS